MQEQYLVGQKTKDFIRVSDGRSLFGCTLNLEEAKEAKQLFRRSKIYKLVEVKK